MEAKRLAMNLRTLQRHDASITEIVDSASYVVLYRYAPKAGGSDETGEPEMAWVRCVCPRILELCMLIRSTMGFAGQDWDGRKHVPVQKVPLTLAAAAIRRIMAFSLTPPILPYLSDTSQLT